MRNSVQTSSIPISALSAKYDSAYEDPLLDEIARTIVSDPSF
jgi:hypothetical protein